MKKVLTFLMMAASATMLHAAAEPVVKAEPAPVQLPAEVAQVENEQLPGNAELEEDDVVILEEDEDDDTV